MYSEREKREASAGVFTTSLPLPPLSSPLLSFPPPSSSLSLFLSHFLPSFLSSPLLSFSPCLLAFSFPQPFPPFLLPVPFSPLHDNDNNPLYVCTYVYQPILLLGDLRGRKEIKKGGIPGDDVGWVGYRCAHITSQEEKKTHTSNRGESRRGPSPLLEESAAPGQHSLIILLKTT